MINYFIVFIKGDKLKRFLVYLVKQGVNFYRIRYNSNGVYVKVSYDDYKKIKEYNAYYDISIVKTFGTDRIISLYSKYKVSLLIFVISIFFVIFLSNLILFINISTDNNSLKEEIRNELFNNNITLFSLNKNFNDLESISNKIKNSNLDDIEWISLSLDGVTLNVKVIPRVRKNILSSSSFKDIVASKDGYIRKIDSSRGQLLKNIGDYVKKGDIIISSNIFRNDEVVGQVEASGKVYAEVWYIVKANESLYYDDVSIKDKGTVSLVLNINSFEISLFSIPKRINNERIISLFRNNTFGLFIKSMNEYKTINKKYNTNDLTNILEIRARDNILNNLLEDEYIIKQKTLKKYINNGRMYIEVFFKTYEDIGEEKEPTLIESKKGE